MNTDYIYLIEERQSVAVGILNYLCVDQKSWLLFLKVDFNLYIYSI